MRIGSLGVTLVTLMKDYICYVFGHLSSGIDSACGFHALKCKLWDFGFLVIHFICKAD